MSRLDNMTDADAELLIAHLREARRDIDTKDRLIGWYRQKLRAYDRWRRRKANGLLL